MGTDPVFRQGNEVCPLCPHVSAADAARGLLSCILFFAEDAALVQAVFQSALDFVERVPVRRLTFVPDARVWEMIG